ncbi:bifunctional folylpolyglutamate synthase/dihydrofolate synthase [Aureliella helgolandensis]|uniref:Dihydrofolate synthase/folylpolyglutamate synthase n=1 Tax=Aureliella helgolandensis TaxID=2527968 RepID=A0A518G5F5_9BACT|nr:folylpolyglutamate synthase/dihydrofolate synthase family protein [Aureliella helgolandensis]QDV23815.1 Folylpolyglutamate synthase [Aureliella helgolandensis]
MPHDVAPDSTKKSTPISPTPPNDRATQEYVAAQDYLYGRINYEKIGHTPYNQGNFRLDRMRQLLELLDAPQRDFPIIHVAGTKGKGTTATLLADGLRGCGRRVGLYSSPHLLHLEERIQVQARPCTPADTIQLTDQVRLAGETLERSGCGLPTFFELTTAMALLHFSQSKVDCAVLEVGLGGRLDSTNVCTPLLSIITSISLDHQAQLGNTIREIAGEKAGIIKPHVPVICTARHPEARARIAEQAAECQAPLYQLERDFSLQWERVPCSPAHAAPSNAPHAVMEFLAEQPPLSGLNGTRWQTQLLGRHQGDNLAGAVAACGLLRQLGWDLPAAPLRAALATSRPRGRLETVNWRPLSIIDTAHNPASIAAGLQALAEHFPKRSIRVVLATSQDKDFRSILRLLLPACKSIHLTAFQGNPRALPIEELENAATALRTELAGENLAQLHTAPTPALAWAQAQELTGPQELVYGTGSFFLAAELFEQDQRAALD